MATLSKSAGALAVAFAIASTVGAYAAPRRAEARAEGVGRAGVRSTGGRFEARGFEGRRVVEPRFRDGRVFRGEVVIGRPFFDPFWGTYYYPYGLFPFAYYPYASYAYGLSLDSDVKVKIAPKDAQVFVDGYYAGVADNFDGAFQELHVAPGGHVISVYLNGYRTLTRSIYAEPNKTVTFKDRLAPLAPGERSAPPAPPRSPKVAPVQPADAGVSNQ